jgi:UDP-N-acetylglucosamine 3-dehydrogenase
MRSAIDLAIIGAGSHGRNHVRVAMGMRDVRVSFVVDTDPVAGQMAADRAGAAYLRSVEGVIGNVDAAIVAVPTEHHLETGLMLLSRGVHTLIEKPLASDVREARQLVEAADAAGALLMVGHVERFNPAILALPAVVSDPIHFETVRVSPFTPRVGDGVIMDLMIHDLDILRSLIPAPIASIKANARTIRSETHDLAVVLLEYSNGVTAALTASRLGQEKARWIRITQASDVIKVDLLRQDITVHSQQQVSFEENGAGYRTSGLIESPFIPNRGEPLAIELEHFVSCVMNGAKPMVSGEDGVAAIELARKIESTVSMGGAA